MEVNERRTQRERSESTRAALIAAARPLFAAHGFAGVGTEAIVQAAGVTRGAMYHQFADKVEVFAAVFEAVEEEMTERVLARAAGADTSTRAGTLEVVEAGIAAWLDACAEPGIQRIVLVDAPAVLGWQRWREVGLRHAVGLIEAVVAEAVAAGVVQPLPVRAVTHVVVGALEEAALYVASSDPGSTARAEVDTVLGRLLAGLFVEEPPAAGRTVEQ
jgi:AcrR family transcriptional regulator